MRVATPEATAFDLFGYLKGAGHLGHVATVLSELSEKMDPKRLVEAAQVEGELANAQRLGHMLERVGASSLAAPLSEWVLEQRPRYVPLRTDRSVRRASKDNRFRVLVNERVEVDT